MKYQISDDQCSQKIEADNMQEAKKLAKESWQNGSWGEGKCLIDVRIAQLD